ncbi:Oidioi.mRNA.OKI2018_I69.PAR.g10005.t1.cds [Oikopleura dioica]|uniref:Oidioi.mRNA.OKI2018_I69.PAR.g10005.t1.cds n=1 Tax=Oikopleura dioica TaxID=34765 RepID=A0ABN7RNN5_OIKDI|nr:Oidioi.mRNA.OKI2018_I69.PAR.g10005.t1.cds [Oikopleura dioica]
MKFFTFFNLLITISASPLPTNLQQPKDSSCDLLDQVWESKGAQIPQPHKLCNSLHSDFPWLEKRIRRKISKACDYLRKSRCSEEYTVELLAIKKGRRRGFKCICDEGHRGHKCEKLKD